MDAGARAALAWKTASNKQHFIDGGFGALPQASRGMPRTGDYVLSSRDLVEDNGNLVGEVADKLAL